MKKVLLIFSVVLLLCSCSAKRDLSYFSDIKDLESGQLANLNFDIKIEPEDELFISVNSDIPEATLLYNLPLNNPAKLGEVRTGMTTQPSTQTYIVDRHGDINFPVLGKVHVAGLTTAQIAEMLTERISKDVENPYVRVEYVNFRFKVLGEVNTPGIKGAFREHMTLFDALALSGDITIYGRKDNVLVIREEDGVRSYQRLNLNDSRSLESPYFYLKQNDVIVVEPTTAREGQSEYNQNNAFKISVVSSIVSAVSVITSLVIALTR